MLDISTAFSLDGRAVLLTGASAGLGRRFAHVLVAAGARTVLIARRKQLLDDLVAELGPLASSITADLADPEQAAAAAAQALDEAGRIDVVVNNAAFVPPSVKAEVEPLDQMERAFAVNVLSPVRIVQTVFPQMRERGAGSIINISSINATHGMGRLPQAGYAATKGALSAVTREWAAQWSRYGIRVNAIAPGFTETELTAEAFRHPKIQEWVLRNTLLPRGGQPEDYDGALLYLASDASRYVTGQVLTVDGGWTAH